MTVRSFMHGGDVYTEKSPTGTWIDFSANINPLGLSKRVKDTIAENIDSLVNYPDAKGRMIKQAISLCYGIKGENIILGNGAAELFYVLFHYLRPQRVLLPVPSFSEYEKAACSVGAEIKYFYLEEERDFYPEENSMLKAMDDCQVLILGNPNNPTGNLLRKDFLAKTVEYAKERNVFVILDESFLDFREDRQLYEGKALLEKYDNLFIITSLTKFYAIPGLRLGFAFGREELLLELEKHKDVWNVNSLAQAVGCAVLEDRSYQEQTRAYIHRVREEFYQELCTIKELKVYKPSVNFILVQLCQPEVTGFTLAKELKKYGILIRVCADYPGLNEKFIRLAVKGREDNLFMLQALKKCLKEE